MSDERKRRIGHLADKHFKWWMLALVTVLVASTWVPFLQYMSVVFTPLNLFMVYAMLKWHSGLCEHCAGDMPLNGSELAEKYHRERRLMHLCDRWRFGRFWMLAPFMAALYGPMLWVPFPWAYLVIYALMVPIFAVIYRHQRVYPWCRQCGWRDGGSEEFVPEMPPSPTGKVNA